MDVEYVNRCDPLLKSRKSEIVIFDLFLLFGENIYNCDLSSMCGTGVD
jgi:hypothetical protein